MKAFYNLSIKNKLMIIIMSISLMAGFLSALTFMLYQIKSQKNYIINNLETLTTIIGNNSSASILFNDVESAEEILSSFKNKPSIMYACLYKKDKTELASYLKCEKCKSPEYTQLPKDNFSEFHDDHIHISQLIILDGEVIGSILLVSNLDDINNLITKNINTFIIICIFLIILVYILSRIMQKQISTPIIQLANTSRTIAEDKDYSQRAIKTSNDEVGFLVESYNHMLSEIESVHFKLNTYNETLEQRVKDRTEVLAVEIQERKKTEESLKHTVKKLETSQEELKTATSQLIQSEKLNAIGELSAGITHELNQPLNVIKIICQALLRDIEKNRFEKDDIQSDLADIIKQINKMADIINHMRSFSRKSDGALDEIIPINQLINNSSKFITQQLKNHSIDLILNLSDDDLKFKGNQIQIEQIIVNLITNAKDALNDVEKIEKKIEVKTFHEDEFIIVEITDNGPGIPEYVKKNIFDAFFTTKKTGKGTGLGLSISTKIINEHKGKISCKSVVNVGTTFRIELPAVTSDQ